MDGQEAAGARVLAGPEAEKVVVGGRRRFGRRVISLLLTTVGLAVLVFGGHEPERVEMTSVWVYGFVAVDTFHRRGQDCALQNENAGLAVLNRYALRINYW